MADPNEDGLDAEILIVGGGPVGLTAALCLAKFGVSSLVIERDAATTRPVPKVGRPETRTMAED